MEIAGITATQKTTCTGIYTNTSNTITATDSMRVVCVNCMCIACVKVCIYASHTTCYTPSIYTAILYYYYTYSDELEGLRISVYNSLIAQTYDYIYNEYKYTIYILIFSEHIMT